jgi:succinoglycan biosynthesis protein ExoA
VSSGVKAAAVARADASRCPDLSDVLIVIPCLDEAANLPRLLLQFQRHAPGALIVVADGGSRDGSQAIVTAIAEDCAMVRLMDNPARLQSAAINAAVEHFGDGRRWLVRVDAHCTYPDDFVALLLAAAGMQRAESVVVPMETRGSGCFQQAVAAAQNSVLGTGGSAHRHVRAGRFVDHGHHALMAIDAFRRVGGYDASFSHNEDAELDHRLGSSGARIWLEPAAAVTYLPRATPAALFRQYRNYGRGRARTVAKHGLRLRLRQFLPLMIVPVVLVAVVAMAMYPVNPQLLPLALPALIWAVAALGLGLILGVRRQSACAAGAGIAAMIMHFAWSLGYWQALFVRTFSTAET